MGVTKIAQAVLELVTDNVKFKKGIDDAVKKLTAINFENARKSLNSFTDDHQKSFASIAKGLGIAAGAVTAATGAIIVLGQRGAAVADVRDSFDSLTRAAGTTADAMLGKLRSGVNGTLSDFELMKLANAALSNGLLKSADDAGTLAAGAKLLADRTGGDTTEAFQTLMSALASGRTAQLKQLGLFIDTKTAVDAYAAAHNLAVGDLTDAQRAQALSAAAIAELRKQTEAAGPPMMDFSDMVDRGKAALSNFLDGLGEAIATSPVVRAGMKSIGESVGLAFGGTQTDLVARLAGWVNTAAIQIVRFAQIAVEMARFVANAWYGLNAIFSGVAQQVSAHVARLAAQTAFWTEFAKGMPGATGAMFAAINVNAKELLRTSAAFSLSFQNDFDKNLDSAGNFNQAVARVSQSLGTARSAMIAAREATANQKAATDKLESTLKGLGVATDDVAAGTRQKTIADKEADVAAKKHKEAVAALSAELSGNKAYADILLLKEAFLSLTPAQRANADIVSNMLARYAALRANVTNPSQLPAELEDIRRKFLSIGDIVQVTNGLVTFGQQVQLSVNPVSAAFERMGLRTRDDLKRTADQAVKDYDLIASSGEASAAQIAEAFEKARAAVAAAADDGKTSWSEFASGLKQMVSVDGILGALSKQGGWVGEIGKVGSAAAKAFAGDWSEAAKLAQEYLGKFVGWAANKLKGLFGGPSAKEVEGRSAAGDFRTQLAGMMSDQQKLEAGSNEWAKSVIVVRDAFLAVGRTEQEAMAQMDALWRAEKQGAGAVAAEVAKINAVLEQQATLAKKTAAVEEEVRAKSAERMKELDGQLQNLLQQRESLAQSIANEAPEEVMGVIEAQTRWQMAALDAQIAEQRKKMEEETANAARTLEEALAKLKPQTVRVPVEFFPINGPDFGGLSVPVRPMANGGVGRVTRPTLFMAGVHGGEDYAFSGEGKSFAGNRRSTKIEVPLYLDGRQIARAVVPHIPAAVEALI